MNDILRVSSNQEISQPGDVDSSCSSNICEQSTEKSELTRSPSKVTESDEKNAISLLKRRDKIKVINSYFFSEVFMIKLILNKHRLAYLFLLRMLSPRL